MHKWEHYLPIYEYHFSRFVKEDSPVTILEIGVYQGGSLELWRNYFGDDAKIIGLDVKPECKQYEYKNTEIYIGDQSDWSVISKIINKYPDIDIVVDDGSHRMKHMIRSFELLYPDISDHGVYLVEDTHACYMKRYEGGLGHINTFIEYAKRRVDDLHYRFSDLIQKNRFADMTRSITFYDSVIVFEKEPQHERRQLRT